MLIELLATAAIAPGCAATPVHYGVNRDAATETAPWVAAGRGNTRLVGYLYTYEPTLGDRRIREASGLVVYAGALNKIGWLPRTWAGAFLAISGRRLDGPGSFRERHRRALAPEFFPSGLTLPSAGCWRLRLQTGSRSWTVHIRAIERPVEPRCDASVVRDGPNPVDPTFRRWVAATPASARLSATLSISVPDVDGAATYAGGRWPDGANTKVLWLVGGARTGSMEIRGRRLDARGVFRQTVNAALAPSYAYPSILDVPEPGCWLLNLRNGLRGGAIVLRGLSNDG